MKVVVVVIVVADECECEGSVIVTARVTVIFCGGNATVTAFVGIVQQT
jgi:hypothetical protein